MGPNVPGAGQSKQPPQAPPVSNDRSSEADRRLADLGSSTGGINPNAQTGSGLYDDMRNLRQPVGNIMLQGDPTGGISGLEDRNYGIWIKLIIAATISGDLELARQVKQAAFMATSPNAAEYIRRRQRNSLLGSSGGRAANADNELWIGGTQVDRRGKAVNQHVQRTVATVASGMYNEVRGTAAGRSGTGFEHGPGARNWKDNLADWWQNALKNPYAKAAGIVIGAAVTAAVIISTGGIASGLAAGGFAAFLATMAVSAGDYANGNIGGDWVSSSVGSKGTAVIDNVWNAQQWAGAAGDIYLLAGGLLKPGLGLVNDGLERAGRWMSKEELAKTLATGQLQPPLYRSIDDVVKYVIKPDMPMPAGGVGPEYIEFSIQRGLIKWTRDGVGRIRFKYEDFQGIPIHDIIRRL